MPIPLVIFEAIGTAQSVSELLDLLLRVLNLQSSDVERLERKWDIKQHADFQSAVQLLRLSRLEADNIELLDIDLLKRGLADLISSWNYYAELNRRGILDHSAELELVYVLSGWLIAKCYLKIQQYEKDQALIKEAVSYYLNVMQFIQSKITAMREPPPASAIMRFFDKVDTNISYWFSQGTPTERMLKALLITGGIVFFGFFIVGTYLALNFIVRVYGNAIHGRPRIQPVLFEKLNEMYFKSLIEVAPYISHDMLDQIGALPTKQSISNSQLI